MKKKLLGLTLVLILIGSSNAQEIVANGGGEGETSNVYVSWTVGEPVIETISNTNTILTQGFQQSKLEIINVSEKSFPEIKVSVFPNPTCDYFTVRIENNDSEVQIALTNMDGKIIHENKLYSNEYKHNVSNLETGTYLLRIVKGDILQTYKIVKNN